MYRQIVRTSDMRLLSIVTVANFIRLSYSHISVKLEEDDREINGLHDYKYENPIL